MSLTEVTCLRGNIHFFFLSPLLIFFSPSQNPTQKWTEGRGVSAQKRGCFFFFAWADVEYYRWREEEVRIEEGRGCQNEKGTWILQKKKKDTSKYTVPMWKNCLLKSKQRVLLGFFFHIIQIHWLEYIPTRQASHNNCICWQRWTFGDSGDTVLERLGVFVLRSYRQLLLILTARARWPPGQCGGWGKPSAEANKNITRKPWPQWPPPALPPFLPCEVWEAMNAVAEEVVLFNWTAGCRVDIEILTDSTRPWFLRWFFSAWINFE